MTKLLCAAAALAILSQSCDMKGGFSAYSRLPQRGWAYGDTVSFTTDSTATAPLLLALRHNESFPFRTLCLELSDSTRRDTMCIDLADSYGRWLGKGVGNSLQLAAPIPFAAKPASRLNIRHIMRVDTLTGIEQLGLIPAK